MQKSKAIDQSNAENLVELIEISSPSNSTATSLSDTKIFDSTPALSTAKASSLSNLACDVALKPLVISATVQTSDSAYTSTTNVTFFIVDIGESAEKIIASGLSTWRTTTSTAVKFLFEKEQVLSFMTDYLLSSLPHMDTSFDIDFNIYEFDFYEREKTSLPCFMIYILFLLFIMDTRLDVDFIIFDIESVTSVLKDVNIKSHVISPKKKNEPVIV